MKIKKHVLLTLNNYTFFSMTRNRKIITFSSENSFQIAKRDRDIILLFLFKPEGKGLIVTRYQNYKPNEDKNENS